VVFSFSDPMGLLWLTVIFWIDNSVSSSSSQAAVFVHIYTDTCTKNVYIYSCIHKIQDPYSHRRLPAMVWLPPTGKMGKLETFCVVPFAFLFAGQIKSVCTQDQRKIRGNRGWFWRGSRIVEKWVWPGCGLECHHLQGRSRIYRVLASHGEAVWGSGDTTPNDGRKKRKRGEHQNKRAL